MGLLENSAAVITGGAQGIGLAIARTFATQGANVVIADLDAPAAEDSAMQLNRDLGRDAVTGVGCDVSDASSVQDALAFAVSIHGSIDIMVNNAGITRDSTMRTMTEDQFDQVVAVHLKGSWNGTRLASVHMREAKAGTIINISSLSGKVGMAGQTNYSAAKAGIIGLTKAAAKELAHHGIRVNAIQPGLIRSSMTEQMPTKIWDQKLSEIPMGRAGEPDEVAAVALFYASPLSSYMTGTVAEVTGGRFM